MRLPTEAELARVLPYSLGTIQKAYGELVRNGLVVRSRGRGSFVAPPQRQMAEPWHCRFLADDGTVLPIYPRLLGHAVAGKRPGGRGCSAKAPGSSGSTAPSRSTTSSRPQPVLRAGCDRKALLATARQVETANFKLILLRELGMPIARIA